MRISINDHQPKCLVWLKFHAHTFQNPIKMSINEWTGQHLSARVAGARGLAEQVNIGLRSGDTGLGITAGLSMAFIAIMADRILRSWASNLGRSQ
ncbi:MAG: hypothetical protein EBT93_01760 [Alphaproteobacteria bacterium]|nr:hypothetical protein [Alphaproteobacteria bacterium]